MFRKIFALLLLLALLIPAAAVQAQGGDTPTTVSPVSEPPTRPMPLIWSGPVRVKLLRVEVKIEDQVAITHIEQVFLNETRREVEGTYFFPLPQDAAISQFNMVVDGKTIEGQIMDKEEARQVYEDIVRRRRDPALLEYVGRDLFQARLFPIPPGGERKIELTYSEVLPLDNGLIHYRHPLRVDHFLGAEGVRGGQQTVDQLAISVDIRSSRRLKAIYSPSHRVIVSREGDYKALVGYEELNVRPASDFDLYFSVDEGEVGVSLLSYKPEGEDGFFLMLAAPGVDLDEVEVVARDVILVLDTSGSMRGEKMEQARQALLAILDRLNPEDRFNIISFSTGLRQFERGPQPTSRLGQARGFVERLEAGGGTDINRALLEALAQTGSERPAVVIFLTDGLPTEGEVDVQHIIDNVRQNAPAGVQLFSFGVGYDVNTVLLDTISQENRGASAYVQPGQAIDEIVSEFYTKVSTPLLSGLALDFDDIFVEELYPYPLPDLFAGSQLVVTGRYRTGGPVTVTLSGRVNNEKKRFVFEDMIFRGEGGEAFIARLWATRKIGYLLNEIRLRGGSAELVNEVVALSTKYGIATPYTSFFVPEPEPVFGLGGPAPQPTRVPAPFDAWRYDSEAGGAAEAPAVAMEAMKAAPASGEAAVEESQAREALRSADQAAVNDASGGLRVVADKTFVLRNGFWMDTLYTPDLLSVDLAFGSQAYFDLLAAHPDWTPYFAAGENLVVVLDGTVYAVTDTGEAMTAPVPLEVSTPVAQPDAVSTPEAEPVEVPTPVVVLSQPGEVQPEAPTGQPAAPCTAPAFGLGLVLIPGLWAWRRQR